MNNNMQFFPMRLFICKVASRCNLDCDYCYVYQFADQSWRQQPKKMSLSTARQLGRRIREHAKAHGLTAVDLVMHGGEPLLAGVDYLDTFCQTIQESVDAVKIRFRMQTNGVLFDENALALCLRWGITVGLSFDGPKMVNDRHRFDHGGHSSYQAVRNALELLTSPEGRKIWSGFLTVVDLQNDPLEVYDYLVTFNPNSIEFLLPLGHYDMWPEGKQEFAATPYADWLLKIFEKWYAQKPQPIRIRRFRDVIALLAGWQDSSEEWGLQPVDFAVVETNGEIQAVDTLKVTYQGANHLGMNIFEHSFDDMFQSPLVLERQVGWSSLCHTCQTCPVVNICGGGYFPHRYSSKNGFRNPSVYCEDLKKIIYTIYKVVQEDIWQVASQQSE